MIILPEGSESVDPSAWSAVEREVYEQKMHSVKPYQYESADALRFELKLRAAIVEAAIDLSRTPVMFASFKSSRCNPRYWKRTDEGGFMLLPGVESSAAIYDIYRNGRLYAFECATAIIIVLYKGVLETIGSASFSRVFGNLYLHSWNHDNDLQLITEYGKQEAFPGDAQYFKNPDIDPRYPQWQGENVIKLPQGNYYGHGIGIRKADAIIAKLNTFRKAGSKVSARLLDEATYPNFFYIQQAAVSGPGLPLLPFPPPSRSVVGRIGKRTYIYV
ncbi:protein-glutamine gamma-glutamyltransferase [Paenibacillus filicis]|uniref:Protein-glutamine gamma-glutamyltransferase n=1 Tax=Paenibacillus gyeongsangnamensis TaxID=3388067 RepID=A0ABT4QAZ4_9BACL|nr:protein-glutamine gamma-glutamyltransferase [Paenibacillus filicis]MCZ8514058.1 protein-glutamine gamma-glutamyltransferase [Paenibacillus filicis]